MTKPSEKRLSGKEAEDWFKRFSQQEGIASRVDVSLEKTVRLLHQKLNTRLRSALLYDAKMVIAQPGKKIWV